MATTSCDRLWDNKREHTRTRLKTEVGAVFPGLHTTKNGYENSYKNLRCAGNAEATRILKRKVGQVRTTWPFHIRKSSPVTTEPFLLPHICIPSSKSYTQCRRNGGLLSPQDNRAKTRVYAVLGSVRPVKSVVTNIPNPNAAVVVEPEERWKRNNVCTTRLSSMVPPTYQAVHLNDAMVRMSLQSSTDLPT
jgi:hypothetical protein